MSNPASLKPFQKGDDPRRNMKGRPVGSRNMSTLLWEALQKEVGEGKNKKSLEEHLVDKILHKAVIKGDFSTIKLIWAYLDGKPPKNKEEQRANREPRKEGLMVVTPEEEKRIEELFAPKPINGSDGK